MLGKFWSSRKVEKPQGILCPHCEKPLEAEHDDKACRRRMFRRVFFGLAVAPLAAKIAGIPEAGTAFSGSIDYHGTFAFENSVWREVSTELTPTTMMEALKELIQSMGTAGSKIVLAEWK